MSTITLDFEKCWNKEDAHYYLRMMVAYNNLLSLRKLGTMISRDYPMESLEPPETYTRNGLDGFVIRQIVSYTAESVKAFVEEFWKGGRLETRRKQKISGPKLTALIKLVYQLDTKGKIQIGKGADGKDYPLYHPDFKKLRECRNTIGFHLDQEDGSAATKAAMLDLKELRARSNDFDDCGYVDAGEFDLIRFPIADQLWSASHMRMSGIPFDKPLSSAEFAYFSEYMDNVTRALIEYLSVSVEQWIIENKLGRADSI